MCLAIGYRAWATWVSNSNTDLPRTNDDRLALNDGSMNDAGLADKEKAYRVQTIALLAFVKNARGFGEESL